MMPVLLGALTLAVMYAVVQDRASTRVGQGVNALVSSVDRLMKPGVAGIGDHSRPVQSPSVADAVSNVVSEATQAASPNVGYGMSSTYENYYQGR